MGFYNNTSDSFAGTYEGVIQKPHIRVFPVSEVGYREYLVELERWASRDPVRENGMLRLLKTARMDLYERIMGQRLVHTYAFSRNAPINRYDYLGWVEYSPTDEDIEAAEQDSESQRQFIEQYLNGQGSWTCTCRISDVDITKDVIRPEENWGYCAQYDQGVVDQTQDCRDICQYKVVHSLLTFYEEWEIVWHHRVDCICSSGDSAWLIGPIFEHGTLTSGGGGSNLTMVWEEIWYALCGENICEAYGYLPYLP